MVGGHNSTVPVPYRYVLYSYVRKKLGDDSKPHDERVVGFKFKPKKPKTSVRCCASVCLFRGFIKTSDLKGSGVDRVCCCCVVVCCLLLF